MVVDIGGVKQGVSCYRPSIQSLRYLLQFCRSFEVNFWFSEFGGTGDPMRVGLRGVRWGIDDFLQVALQNP